MPCRVQYVACVLCRWAYKVVFKGRQLHDAANVSLIEAIAAEVLDSALIVPLSTRTGRKASRRAFQHAGVSREASRATLR